MVVSIPEKTLEHWASIYLTYRYRSHAALWWPAHGEDINVGSLPPTPGKVVQIELKTTYINSVGDMHQVKISLKQLDRYLRRPHGERPFYVFPRPSWTGRLEMAASADGVPPTEVGFRRAARYPLAKEWWFAEWLRVLTTNEVAAIVATELGSYRAGTWSAASDSVTLVTFDLSRARLCTTWADSKRHRTIRWLDMWDRLDACGEPSWPQLVRLPASLLQGRRWRRLVDMRGLLAEAIDVRGDLITLGSDDNEGFSYLDQEPYLQQAGNDRGGAGNDGGEQGPDHRIVVFLGVEALRLT